MRNPNGILELDEVLAGVCGWEGAEKRRRAVLARDRLGETLFMQVIKICDDHQWEERDLPLRIYLAACAFLTALEATDLEPRERIMRLLLDVIIVKEARVDEDTQIEEYLRAMAEGVELDHGDRWHPKVVGGSKRPCAHKLLLADSSPPSPAA